MQVGLPCCALYSEDGAWYRGVVTAVGPTGADVFFVDYGNAETVPLESLRALPPGLLALPRQALRCALRDFQAPVSDALTERLDPLLTEQVSKDSRHPFAEQAALECLPCKLLLRLTGYYGDGRCRVFGRQHSARQETFACTTLPVRARRMHSALA